MTIEEAIKLFETLLLHVDTDCVMGMETTEAINLAIKALGRPPVIRCGECEHWKHNDNFVQGKCKVTKLYPKRDWFCGSGEPRRGGEQ